MKSWKTFVRQLYMMAFLFPAVLLSGTRFEPLNTGNTSAQQPSQAARRCITVDFGGSKSEMELETYVVGVVLAEMPAEFEPEALKAQAAAARTFAWKAASTGGKHGDGSVCTDFSCCQGYVSETDFIENYGTQEELKKIKDAVSSTADMVVTYQGNLIEATYFSSSGGFTEDAAAVWGGSYPYLVSKESPEEAREGETFSVFSSAFLESTLHTKLDGPPDTWFHDWEFTNGGGVASVGIGNRVFSGTAIREALNLRSTIFTVSIENDVVVFHTIGYGHRVGMSQLGADAMALEGKTYDEILCYYYTGTELTPISALADIAH